MIGSALTLHLLLCVPKLNTFERELEEDARYHVCYDSGLEVSIVNYAIFSSIKIITPFSLKIASASTFINYLKFLTLIFTFTYLLQPPTHFLKKKKIQLYFLPVVPFLILFLSLLSTSLS